MRSRPGFIFLIAFVAVRAVIAYAVCPSFNSGISGGTMESSLLDEASGIAASRQNSNVFWVHNDKGGLARLFAFNSSGTHLGIYTLSGADATDYEDIAIGPGPVAENDYIYVADTGDNNRKRSSVTVYRVAEPAVSSTQPEVTISLTGVEALTLTYPDNIYDSETLLVDPISGDIFLVTRDRQGKGDTHVYRKPAPHVNNSTTVLQYITTIVVESEYEIKGGDISPSGDKIILRPHDSDDPVSGMLFNRAEGTNLWEAFDSTPCSIPLIFEPQGEAICFDANGCGYYTLSEGINPPLYYYSTTSACPKPIQAGDVDGDGTVNIVDLSTMGGMWLENACDKSGLAANWKLNGNANDSTSNSYHATVFGDPVWNPEGYIEMNGDDYLEVTGYNGITGTGSRTVAGWINTSATQPGSIVSWGDSSYYGGKWNFEVLDYNGTSGALQIEVMGDGKIVGSTDLRDGQWHHIAAVLKDDGAPDVNQTRLFVDGKRETLSLHISGSINTGNLDNVLIGALVDGSGSVIQKFNGKLADVRIYNEALSDEQILNLAITGCAKPDAVNLDGFEGVDYFDFAILQNNWQDSI